MTTESTDHNEVQWVYEQDNKWINYDPETSEQIENNLKISIKQKQKLMLVVKLKHGPNFSKPECKEKYIVNIQLDATSNPPVIWKSVQTSKLNKKEMINITRFPPLDFHSTPEILDEIKNYKCKYKWFWKSERDPDDDESKLNTEDEDNDNDDVSEDEQEYNPWKEYDAITSAQIELTLNKKQKFTILNKSNFFKSPKNKNLYRVVFNHHSIGSEATQIKFTSLRNKKKTEIMYERLKYVSVFYTMSTKEMSIEYCFICYMHDIDII